MLVWAVFIVGLANDPPIPLHHMPPLLYRTQAACEEEIPYDLANVITFVDSDYHLECRSVRDMSGDPA
jgi:hypothetical protein